MNPLPARARLGDSSVNYGFIAIAAIFVVALAIPTIVFGYEDELNPCQRGTRAGLELSDWVKVAGIEPLGVTALILFSVPFFNGIMYTKAVSILHFVFWCAWSIIGIVILATNENNRCVSRGTAMAVIGIINVPLSFVLSFAYAAFACA